MLRFSLSGAILVVDAVQSTAAMASAANAAIFAFSLAVAVVTALPEVARWATAFVNGDSFALHNADPVE